MKEWQRNERMRKWAHEDKYGEWKASFGKKKRPTKGIIGVVFWRG